MENYSIFQIFCLLYYFSLFYNGIVLYLMSVWPRVLASCLKFIDFLKKSILHILYKEIISSLNLLYSREARFNFLIVQNKINFLMKVQSVLQLFVSFSIFLLKPFKLVFHTGEQYSKCGRTKDLYNVKKVPSSIYLNVCFNNPRFLLAKLILARICSLKFKFE